MLSTARYITILGLCAAFCMMIVGCAGCAKKSSSSKTPAAKPVVALSENDLKGTFTDQTIVFRDAQNRMVWSAEVKSGNARSENGKQVLTLHGVKCHLFKLGSEVALINADTGTAMLTGKTVQTSLSGHIFTTEKVHGQQLTADRCSWNSQEDRLHASKFLWRGENMQLSADQGIFTTDLTQANFNGHVRMESGGQTAH